MQSSLPAEPMGWNIKAVDVAEIIGIAKFVATSGGIGSRLLVLIFAITNTGQQYAVR
jgi:hypothetical protein